MFTMATCRKYYCLFFCLDAALNHPGKVGVYDIDGHGVETILLVGIVGISSIENAVGSDTHFTVPARVALEMVAYIYDVSVMGNQFFCSNDADGMPDVLSEQMEGVEPPDDGKNALASFRSRFGVIVGATANVFAADTVNSLTRKIFESLVKTLAGGRIELAVFKDGVEREGWFANPQVLTLDGNGGIYVANTGNPAIRRNNTDIRTTTMPVNYHCTGLSQYAATPEEKARESRKRDGAGVASWHRLLLGEALCANRFIKHRPCVVTRRIVKHPRANNSRALYYPSAIASFGFDLGVGISW